jgi:hypothetical protein
MNIKKKYRDWSDLFSENREFMRIYKQLTPTRHGSALDTLRYYRQHRNRTYKLFGFIDTGLKDYGMNLHHRPWHTARLYACMYRIWRIQRRAERNKRARWRG